MTDKTIEILTNIGIAAAMLIGGWIVIKILLRIEKKALQKSKIDGAVHLFILRSTKIALWVLLIIAILPKSAPFVAALGASGAAIALALKDSLGNVAGGILLLMNKPFMQGDIIEVNNTSGVVDSIDLMTTRLHTFDNKVVTVPNGVLNTSVIVNHTKEDIRRVDCLFGISYDSDIKKAKDILLDVVRKCEGAYSDPAPAVGVSHHGDSAILLDLKVWCGTSDYYVVKYYLEEEVKLAFDKENIVIPYPHMDIRVTK